MFIKQPRGKKIHIVAPQNEEAAREYVRRLSMDAMDRRGFTYCGLTIRTEATYEVEPEDQSDFCKSCVENSM